MSRVTGVLGLASEVVIDDSFTAVSELPCLRRLDDVANARFS